MNLRILRTFVATVETGGLARACSRLNLSQAAASRQIQALEMELGVKLFHRVRRSMKLTAEGEDILQHCRRVLSDADRLSERAQVLKGGKAGTLRIAATPQVIAAMLSRFLPRFRDRHPGIALELLEGGATSQPDRIERGEVHLAIMPAGDERFAGKLLYPVHALAVVCPTHRFAQRKHLEVRELAAETLIALKREFGSRAWLDAACELENIRPRIVLESSAVQTLIELAAVNYAVAVVPSTSIFNLDSVSAIPIVRNRASIGRWSVIAWDRHRQLPTFGHSFVNEITAYSRRNFPNHKVIQRAPPLPKPRHASE